MAKHVSIPSYCTHTVIDLARKARGFYGYRSAPDQQITLPILADALHDASAPEQLIATVRAGAAVTDTLLWELAYPEQAAQQAAQKRKEAREKKYTEARKGIAVALAESWHARISDLFSSKRGAVEYGHGGSAQLDWDAYGKRGYHNPHTGRKQPAKWRNAGARITGYARAARIVIENSRGNVVARLPLPPKEAVMANHRGLVSGDIYLVAREIGGRKIARRYGVAYSRDGGKRIGTGYVRTGVAVQFSVPDYCREQGRRTWSVFSTTLETYWEHGADVAECRAENERKLALAERYRAEDEAAQTLAAEEQARRAAVERLAQRVAALCPGLLVTDADRQSCGFCRAGTDGFLARHNLTGRDSIPASALRAAVAVSGQEEDRISQIIFAAARRVAAARLATVVSSH